VQLILDALDGVEPMSETAKSAVPSWGLQVFGGAAIFAKDESADIFQQTRHQIEERLQTA
jgi:hypothetical protein